VKTIACVLVRTARAFTWLGHMPHLAWTLDQLRDVRGVSKVVCAAAPDLVKQATALVGDDTEVVVMPAAVAKRPAAAEAWASAASGPAADADVLVLVRPTSPFLPAAKIEACLEEVLAGRCSTCYPARRTEVVSNGRRRPAAELVESVRVVRLAARAEPAHRADSAVGTVPVSLIESLDVEVADERNIAALLARGGAV
jgi:hypothetical protein